MEHAMQKPNGLLFLLVALLCANALPSVANAQLHVIATTPDLAAVAKVIGGKHAEVSALSLPTQDPHWVDARPHLALDLARADMLIAVGLGLEVGWLPVLQTGSRNSKVGNGGAGYLEVASAVNLLEVPQGKVDRSMGDIHPGGNPHFMLDPRRAALVADAIAKRMSSLDPAHTTDFTSNANSFKQQLNQARARWEQTLASLRGTKVITYHRSLEYLADWLGFKIIAQLEEKPGIPPNPRHVTEVLLQARSEGVKLILQEAWFPVAMSEMLAERSSAKLVRLAGGPDFIAGDSYIHFMDTVVKQLSGAQ
jgi:zinc/manganese transport system substrate-binding protein